MMPAQRPTIGECAAEVHPENRRGGLTTMLKVSLALQRGRSGLLRDEHLKRGAYSPIRQDTPPHVVAEKLSSLFHNTL